ncbi:aromatic-L-amino-acid decarboxylase-like isoform X2 [Macrosteles quadrilineatus]|uniref:aromatic-L-amino-acid decarboxylase-like isoform X2 n=1 Tax=Macrosteles quadrilineatus TaxID=74068 RepID=UPI0023E2546D|nr:aromatic-L-amino-acid decarboxylase-like isoform X2 [Macrosteles quadrilineatus]
MSGKGMDTAEFRVRGKEMVDYMCKYNETLPEKCVVSKVKPGYLKELLPTEPPENPESWDDIMRDVDAHIMPGITHWEHPRFHAYFPSGNSYPSILGDMLSDIIGCIGFSWAASPACTELETIVMDWMAHALGLPSTFLSTSKGGGVIQGSASDCVLTCMLAARLEALRKLQKDNSASLINEDIHLKAALLPKLVAYCSREAHSCVEKAASICLVRLRILEPDEENVLRGDILKKAMEEDIANGLVPFFALAITGSTGSCTFDNLTEMGQVCRAAGVWLHVDAAYAGCAMICPELRYLMKGVELAQSFNTNTNKFFLVNFDCSLLYVKDRQKLVSCFNVDPLYLKHQHENVVFDYRHWGIPLSRRFRSLKLWFVLRSYGISGMQEYIRNHIKLAKRFENHVRQDKRFEVNNDPRLGLVCFRLRSEGDALTTSLLANINQSGKLHMVPARCKEKYIIRFCVVAQNACEADIDYAWKVITDFAAEILTPESPRILCSIPTTPEGRKLSRQFSFTRTVSQTTFKRSVRNSLYDGATPVVLVDEDTTNVFDEVFENARKEQEQSKDKE